MYIERGDGLARIYQNASNRNSNWILTIGNYFTRTVHESTLFLFVTRMHINYQIGNPQWITCPLFQFNDTNLLNWTKNRCSWFFQKLYCINCSVTIIDYIYIYYEYLLLLMIVTNLSTAIIIKDCTLQVS